MVDVLRSVLFIFMGVVMRGNLACVCCLVLERHIVMCSGWSRSVEGVKEGDNVMGLILNHLYEPAHNMVILGPSYKKKLENVTLVFYKGFVGG